jgi:hypothetical protein
MELAIFGQLENRFRLTHILWNHAVILIVDFKRLQRFQTRLEEPFHLKVKIYRNFSGCIQANALI